LQMITILKKTGATQRARPVIRHELNNARCTEGVVTDSGYQRILVNIVTSEGGSWLLNRDILCEKWYIEHTRE
jgi:hypothetical protein